MLAIHEPTSVPAASPRHRRRVQAALRRGRRRVRLRLPCAREDRGHLQVSLQLPRPRPERLFRQLVALVARYDPPSRHRRQGRHLTVEGRCRRRAPEPGQRADRQRLDQLDRGAVHL